MWYFWFPLFFFTSFFYHLYHQLLPFFTGYLQVSYSHCDVLLSLSKPQAVAPVQTSHLRFFSASHAPLLRASDAVSGLADHNICTLAAPQPQSIHTANTTIFQTIALHTTCKIHRMPRRISICHHRSPRSSPHPSGNHMEVLRLTELQVFLGWQTSRDTTFGHSWPQIASSVNFYLICTFKGGALHAVGVITADPC